MSSAVTNQKRGSKSLGQLRAIFGLAKQRGLSDDELRSLVEETTRKADEAGKRSISALSRHEAALVIDRLNGQSSTPRRTTQHRRKVSGVVQIASSSHLELMRSLAARRGLPETGLENLSARIIGHYPPRTTAETNKVVEALKAMNRRAAA